MEWAQLHYNFEKFNFSTMSLKKFITIDTL
jgi:hypothetical protein